jgi:hypothetical protein
VFEILRLVQYFDPNKIEPFIANFKAWLEHPYTPGSNNYSLTSSAATNLYSFEVVKLGKNIRRKYLFVSTSFSKIYPT